MERTSSTRRVRRLATAAVVAASVVVAGAGTALAGLVGSSLPGAGFAFVSTTDQRVQVRGAGVQLASQGPIDVKTTYSTVPPTGALLGWHHHLGPVVVSVATGTLTLVGPNCDTWDIGPGQAYVEHPGQVINAYLDPTKNAGIERVQWFTTRLLPAGAADPVEDPAPCVP